MEKIIAVGNFNLSYNIEELVKQAKRLEWDEWLENEDNGTYSISESKFNENREKFIKEIESIESKLESLFKSNVHVTKKGTIHASKRSVILSSDLITSYDDSYGSHSYEVPSLIVVSGSSSKTAHLILIDVKYQSPF